MYIKYYINHVHTIEFKFFGKDHCHINHVHFYLGKNPAYILLHLHVHFLIHISLSWVSFLKMCLSFEPGHEKMCRHMQTTKVQISLHIRAV